ncbi:transposase, partial [Erwinia tracheiphila PSU-1]
MAGSKWQISVQLWEKMLPLSPVVAAANTHDIRLVADTPDALQTGRQVQKPGL